MAPFVRSAIILKVVVQGRVIRTTAEHPFWVDGRGWTAAGELKAGDNLLTADKSKLPVENVFETGDIETVYNFRVADWHTYFVGKEDWHFEVWVHNACKTPGSNGPNKPNPGNVSVPQHPAPKVPSSPEVSPGPEWVWRGKPGEPIGGNKGGWFNPTTGETLHPDLGHGGNIGPHWDWRDPSGNFWRIFTDGRIDPRG